MEQATIIEAASQFVMDELGHEATGHDWWHARRVAGLALTIAQSEGADELVCQLAAWLHDLADPKVVRDETLGRQTISAWLSGQGVDSGVVESVMAIISTLSFAGGSRPPVATLEGKVVQDADRLDAIGAIGVARAFAFGGAKGRLLYDPASEPRTNMSVEDYRSNYGSTITHFYEKLLLLKGRLNTDAAREIAGARHAFLEGFLREFLREWGESCSPTKTLGEQISAGPPNSGPETGHFAHFETHRRGRNL